MIQHKPNSQRILASLGTVTILGSIVAVPVTAQAQRHHSFLGRHRKLAGAAAGIAAYKVAKHTGRNRAAAGGHRNFAQRHPYLTGAAAAIGTHHLLKHR